MRWANFQNLWPPNHLGFWLVAAVPAVVVGLVLLSYWWRRVMETMGHCPQIQRMAESVSAPRRIARAVLLVCAIGLAVTAWVRPQTEGKPEKVKRRGLDMVLVVDFSKSMYVRDIPRSRIEKAKVELNKFIDALDGDRVGLVAFAGTVKPFPLTTDYNAAKLFYQELAPNDMPVGGTAIGKAVTAAVRMLKRVRKSGRKRAQVIILLTDGEDHQSDPLAAAKMAAKLGIKVYTLGIGSRSGDLVPVMLDDGSEGGKMKKADNSPVVSRLDESTLAKMAEITGGKYFRATPGTFRMAKISRAMKDLKRTATKAALIRRRIEQFHWFLWPALFLLLVELCLGDRKLRFRRGSAASQRPAGAGQ
jgi:Ca-activated chloride channel family protein